MFVGDNSLEKNEFSTLLPPQSNSCGRKFTFGCCAFLGIAAIVVGILAYNNTFGKVPDSIGGGKTVLGVGIGLPVALALITGMYYACKSKPNNNFNFPSAVPHPEESTES